MFGMALLFPAHVGILGESTDQLILSVNLARLSIFTPPPNPPLINCSFSLNSMVLLQPLLSLPVSLTSYDTIPCFVQADITADGLTRRHISIHTWVDQNTLPPELI